MQIAKAPPSPALRPRRQALPPALRHHLQQLHQAPSPARPPRTRRNIRRKDPPPSNRRVSRRRRSPSRSLPSRQHCPQASPRCLFLQLRFRPSLRRLPARFQQGQLPPRRLHPRPARPPLRPQVLGSRGPRPVLLPRHSPRSRALILGRFWTQQPRSCNEDGTASNIRRRMARAVLPAHPDADDSVPAGPLALQPSVEAIQQVGQRGFRYQLLPVPALQIRGRPAHRRALSVAWSSRRIAPFNGSAPISWRTLASRL